MILFLQKLILLNVLEMLGLHFQQVCVSDVRHIQLGYIQESSTHTHTSLRGP
jgi:hypothetical protein